MSSFFIDILLAKYTSAIMSNPAPRNLFVQIGKKIASARSEIGLSQRRLSQKIGISQSLLALYELGKRRIPISTLLSITTMLSVSLDDLLPTGKRHGPVSKVDRELARVKTFSRGEQQVVIDVIKSIANNSKDKTMAS